MKQMLRRITSLVMALLVLVSLLPLQSFATEADSTQTPSDEESTSVEATVETADAPADPTETTEPETVPSDEDLRTGSQEEPISFYLINNKARAIVDQAVTKVRVYTGEHWYDLWYFNKWTQSWEIWGSYWHSDVVYLVFASGTIGYCIQPYNSAAALNQDRVPVSWGDIVTPYRTSSDGFEEAKAQGISLAMAYGSPNNGDSSTSGCYATAAIIWGIGCGHIRPDGTIRDSDSSFLDALLNGFWDDDEMASEIEQKYNELLVCLQNHGKIPSFSAGSRAELTDANTITLQYDASSGLYTASVTDTNGILKYFNYQSSVEGLTFEKSGNTLIVKATPAAVAQLGSSSVIHSRGHEVTVGPDSVIVWNTEDNASQAMVTMNVEADPVPSYFTLAVPKGSVKIVKTTEDGKNLAGWQFGIYSDAACTNMISGPHASGSDGTITVSGLDVGTVWVKEIGHTDAAINAMYQCGSTNPQQVTIQSGQTATVSFRNNLRFGQCQIIKETTNGGSKAGWHFTVKDSGGKVVGTYVTDATGIITLDLEPGTYTVTETDGAYKYWVNDPTPTKTVTVKAGETAKVTFTNQWRGQAQIVKTATNGGSVAGWHFTVKNSSGTVVGNYVTDATGIITLDLEPGTYTVTETDGVYKYWVNDPTPTKTVTVKAGETAKVTFTNQWRGQAQIVKTATNGGSVSGWHFTVKNSSGTVVGNYVTDATGIITLDLEPGTYTVTETDGVYKYWVNDPTPTKTVTVKAGETAKVTFTNQWRGQAQIVKTATNGGSVAGWHFTVKNSSGTVIGNYVTDATGIITLDLEPGTYTVTETDGKYEYWHNDPTPVKTVTVKAGETAKVTFQNQWIGKAKIIKTLANPEAGTVEGWKFTITDANGSELGTYQTDSTGTILVDLEPGTYTVKEVLEDNSLWQCTNGNPQTITVEAGKTAEVTFTNALRPGEITIQKVNYEGMPLAGAEFLLEWSEDGSNWAPVTYTDAAIVSKGTCSSANLQNGKLVSSADGWVLFSGLYPTLQYRLTETEAPDGYQLLAGYAYKGVLPEDGNLTVSLTVVNVPIFVLPETGSTDMFRIPLSAALCIWIGAGLLLYLRKRQGE